MHKETSLKTSLLKLSLTENSINTNLWGMGCEDMNVSEMAQNQVQ
jgi:hypothetical protein